VHRHPAWFIVPGMIIKHVSDHLVKHSPTCGEIREILRGEEFSPNIALAINIGVTTAHYRLTFDEIYFVLDGILRLKFYDPATDQKSEVALGPGELCVITKGIHHKVIEAPSPNRLCVITTPQFQLADEHFSDKL
jgi:mannose-6-phosphate isomerase-like protein (cupin superfamily)